MKNRLDKEYDVNLETLEEELKEPASYQINMHNDDFTPMEFVVSVLEKFFYMDRRKATAAMLEIHMKGQTVVGRFTKDVAETKVAEVIRYARTHDHPLMCSMQAAS